MSARITSSPPSRGLSQGEWWTYLDGELEHRYARIAVGAIHAAESLAAAWQRPVRHNRKIERAALFHVLELDLDCMGALESPLAEMLLPPGVTARQRYELSAGALIVREVLPFADDQREKLRIPNMRHDWEFESDRLMARQPRLTERWHEWLWADAHGNPQRDVGQLGASAVLAEGCRRLATVVPRILGWEERGPRSLAPCSPDDA